MALLDSFYGETPAYLGGLLGEDELKRLQGQAQSQSNLGMATALLQAGAPSRTPGGGALAIAQGLQQGQDLYRKTLNQGLQEKMVAMQLGEQTRKLQESARMREMFPQIFKVEGTPEQQITEQNWSGAPEQIGQYFQTGAIPTQTTTVPSTRTMSVDTNKLQALAAMSANPLETYASLAKLVPDLRKAGFIGAGTQGDNPFNIFVNDATVPAPLRAAAQQYQKSYANGMLDPEKADERVRQLAQSIQSAQQFEQTNAGLMQNRQALQTIAQQNADARAAAEANKPEQFSYSQKKEFDSINAAREEAKKAEANSSIAQRAAPLLSQAYGSQAEAVLKGVTSAVVPGFTADAKKANDDLERYSQTLAVNAPRFSGPTSDADAKRYDKAVGDLGNPKITLDAKKKALQEIQYLGQKSRAYADQSENFFYENKKSLRGFKFSPPPDPFAEQNAPY
jgi:hypothetical protein